MKRRNYLTIVLLAGLLTAVGCTANGCDTKTWQNPFQTDPAGGPAGGTPRAGDSGQKDWVIVLNQFNRDDRQRRAIEFWKLLLSRNWHGIRYFHDANEQVSYVYWGPFAAGQELRDNLNKVRDFHDAHGDQPFAMAYERQLPAPDPPAPPEFNLANAPASAAWSLQIAHFVTPSPAFKATEKVPLPKDWNRKKAAVDYCLELRKQGLEAYYYHTETPPISIVTVGSFPPEVFANTGTAYVGYDPRKKEYLDPGINRFRNRDFTVVRDGRTETVKQFQYNTENGQMVSRWAPRPGGGMELRPQQPSFLVQIPRPEQDTGAPRLGQGAE